MTDNQPMTEINRLDSVDFDTDKWGISPVVHVAPPAEAAIAETVATQIIVPEAKSEIDFDSLLKEKTNGRYNTLADLDKKVEATPFEFGNETSQKLFEHFKSGNIDEILDIAYSQQMLNKVNELPDEDVIKMRIAFENPEFSEDDVEDEYNNKHERDAVDTELMDDGELKKHNKELKAFERQYKKEVKDAKVYLDTKKQDLNFPDLPKNTTDGQAVDVEKAISDRMSEQQKLQQDAYTTARNAYIQTIEPAVKEFEGFTVEFKDEDVQFSGKYSLSDADKASLKQKAESFDLDDYYVGRYSKDGVVNTKQILEDIYLLENRDKILQSMVSQSVSKAKADLLRNIKGIEYEPAKQRFTPSPEDREAKAADFFFGR